MAAAARRHITTSNGGEYYLLATMRLRTALSLANLAAIVVAFLVLFEFPVYAQVAFYGLVAWIFVGFGLMYLRGARAAPAGSGSAPAGTSPGVGGAPLPSGGGAGPPAVSLDFCVWCGTTLPPSTSVCPACGRRVAVL